MTHPDRLVVKVGGSLYDHPKLKDGLKAWLAARPEAHVLIVPGGGDFAEAVRRLDTVHGLGDQVAHELALRSLDTATMFLAGLLDVMDRIALPQEWYRYGSPAVMVLYEMFMDEYAAKAQVHLPQTWEFTTDSLAACAAHDAGCKLVLLKSVDIPATMSWQKAADRGNVDAYFPTLVARHGLSVTAVNFRRVLDAY